MIGVSRRNRCGTGQGHAQGFGDRGHGRRRAHGHAMPVGAGDAGLDLLPLLLADDPGAAVVPVFPDVAAATQGLAFPVSAQHRPGRHENRRQVHADRAHQQARRGLVAAAQQHGAVDRVRAQQFLGLHRQEIAIEHGGGLDERFGQRHRRQFDRESARLPDATLDLLGPGSEMRMAGVDVAPGVDDGDHRLAGEVLMRIAHLQRTRAVPEGAQVVDAEPAAAAQVFRLLAGFLGHVGLADVTGTLRNGGDDGAWTGRNPSPNKGPKGSGVAGRNIPRYGEIAMGGKRRCRISPPIFR